MTQSNEIDKSTGGTDHAEKALDEIQTFIRRQDVPPGLSTLDENLKAAERHLEAICDE